MTLCLFHLVGSFVFAFVYAVKYARQAADFVALLLRLGVGGGLRPRSILRCPLAFGFCWTTVHFVSTRCSDLFQVRVPRRG